MLDPLSCVEKDSQGYIDLRLFPSEFETEPLLRLRKNLLSPLWFNLDSGPDGLLGTEVLPAVNTRRSDVLPAFTLLQEKYARMEQMQEILLKKQEELLRSHANQTVAQASPVTYGESHRCIL